MKKLLITTMVLALMAGPAFAGNFGSAGSNAPHDAAAQKASDEAKANGATDEQAEAAGEAAAAKSKTDERNGNLGVYIDNN